LQTSLAAGVIHSLQNKPLRVNDAFYLQNFKGIKNLGYHFDDGEQAKKGLGGDILGFDRYLSLSVKASQNFAPLLSDWGIDPFVFANAALVPSRDQE
jgi:hypothetical protein